jgi:hypothetical protein
MIISETTPTSPARTPRIYDEEPSQAMETQPDTQALTAATPTEVEVMPADVRIEGTAASARRWVDMAQRFARCTLACQVMAGFELEAIKKARGVRRGGDRRSNPSVPGLIWEEFVRQEVGISADTASVWMRMADAVRPRLKKLPGAGEMLREILARPVAELTEAQAGLLAETVRKICDGRTQMDFLIELGLAKAPQGAAAVGGDHGGGRKPLTPEEQYEAQRQLALTDWGDIANKIQAAKLSFTHVPDEQLDRLISGMEAMATAMRAWRTAPAAARTPELMREIEALL